METKELFGCDLSQIDTKTLKNKLSAYKMLIYTSRFIDNCHLLDHAFEFIMRVETELLHRKEIFIDDGITPKKIFEEFKKMSV